MREVINIKTIRKLIKVKGAVAFVHSGYVSKQAIIAFLDAVKSCELKSYIETGENYTEQSEKATRAVRAGSRRLGFTTAKQRRNVEKLIAGISVIAQLGFAYRTERSRGARVFYIYAMESIPLAEAS